MGLWGATAASPAAPGCWNLASRLAAAHRSTGMTRQDLRFPSGGTSCAAWHYPAAGDAPSAPIVVMAHGLSGTRRDGLESFAESFAGAGFAALVFDHRGFGDSDGEPDRFDPTAQLGDWRAAIAFARSLGGIDPQRVATFGSSMGGGNALAAETATWPPRSARCIPGHVASSASIITEGDRPHAGRRNARSSSAGGGAAE
jgi:alpha-beta hydrolase superfamily lysophospholipase